MMLLCLAQLASSYLAPKKNGELISSVLLLGEKGHLCMSSLHFFEIFLLKCNAAPTKACGMMRYMEKARQEKDTVRYGASAFLAFILTLDKRTKANAGTIDRF
jgi:hypothetical protein